MGAVFLWIATADSAAPLPHSLTLDTLGPIIGDAVTLEWDANPETIASYTVESTTGTASHQRHQNPQVCAVCHGPAAR